MTTSGHPKSKVPGAIAKIAVVLGILFLALLISGVVAGAAMLRSFRSSAEFGGLHRELIKHLDVSRDSDVEVALPAWALALGRVGASMADLDPEVTTALATLQSGQIGVYGLAERPTREAALGMLKLADARLLERGNWSRIVTVLDEGQLVAIYSLDEGQRSQNSIKVFLIVLDDRELVIAAARGCPRPLFELVSTRHGRLDLKEFHL